MEENPMSKKVNIRWVGLVIANVLVWCVLSFYGSTAAAPQSARQPFSNPVEQRHEMIRELKEIKALLKEQNALLRNAATRDAVHDRSEPNRTKPK